MTDEDQDSIWPMPKFYFSVEFGDYGSAEFQEVSGLDTEVQPIEYRAGDSPTFSNIKMPGIAKSSNVTLKKGVFAADHTFWDWFSGVKLNTIARQSVVIRLLDEGGNPTMVWKLTNAWPIKVSGTDLKSDGTEIAVETIEFACERLTIENAT